MEEELFEEARETKQSINEKKNILKTISIILFCLFVIVMIFYFNSKYDIKDSETIKCIAENSKLIIKQGCSACAKQEQELGDFLDYFEIIDITDNGDIVQEYSITKIPTWIINNETYEGVKTIKELQELTGCFQEESEEYYHITEESIIEDCKNKDLKKTAYCLRDNIKKFYKYNNTDDEYAKNITIEEIINVGSDCGGYAYLYKRMAEKINYSASTVRIAGDGIAHRTAIINNKEGFCIINILHVECFMY